jgi:hypothetical protein
MSGPGKRSRRRLLTEAAALAIATMLGPLAGCTLGPPPPKPRDAGDDLALLDNLLGLQNEAVAAYAFVLAAGALDGAEREQATRFAEDHRKHAEALARSVARMGGTAVAAAKRDYGFSSGAVAQRSDAIDFLIGIEQGLTLADLGAVPAFVSRGLAKDAAAMLGVEAMHWALWRRALGQDPVPAPFLTQ